MLVITTAVAPRAPCSEYRLPEGDDCNNARKINNSLFAVVTSQRDLSSRGVYSMPTAMQSLSSLYSHQVDPGAV